MTGEPRRGSLRELCARIRALDPAAPPGARLEEIAHDLEVLDASRLTDLAELHRVNRLMTVGTLATGITHELGTPLGVVLARAQMIVEESLLAEVHKDAEVIVQQVKRMTQMCREVLDFARPRPATRDPVDVVQVLRQLIALLAPEARLRTTTLVLADPPPPLRVLADPSKLMQILTNLAINAAQAMPRGGTVTLAVERRRVAPPADEQQPEADYVCIAVTDTGVGIRAADMARIFEPFFTTKQVEGTGIGLAVSVRMAREHDGWIGVVSEEGRGSTFTLYLPPLR